MRSSRRPSPARLGRAMERNKVSWTMVHTLRLIPTEPAWRNVNVLVAGRRRPDRPDR